MLRFIKFNPYRRIDILEAAIRRLAVRLEAAEKRLAAVDLQTAKHWGATSETLKESEKRLAREVAPILVRELLS